MPTNSGKAKRSKKSDTPITKGGKKKVDWKGYVNFPIDDGVKRSLQAWLDQEPDFDQLIEDAAQNGYDLKVRYDTYNQCFTAQFFCTDIANDDGGWCLSMRASGWYKALQRLLYIHYICLEQVWSDSLVEGWSDDNW